MSVTIMSNRMNQGTRRLQTLGAMWGLGAALSDTAQGMISEGYNAVQIQQAVDAGASDQQLQYLWDNFGPGTPEFGQAITALVAGLAPSGSFIDSGALPQSVVSVINTAFGTWDLSVQASWDVINSQFSQTQQALQILARQAPKDPDVIDMVTQFNSMVAQWAGYYSQAVGTAPANLPMVGLSGLGIAPVIIAGVAAAIVALLGTLYLLNQRIVAKNQTLQAQAELTSAQAASGASAALQQQAATLNAQAQSARSQAAALPAGPQQTTFLNQAAALQAQANQLLGQAAAAVTPPGAVPVSPTNWSAWLQQNMGLLIAGLAAIVIVPAVMRRR